MRSPSWLFLVLTGTLAAWVTGCGDSGHLLGNMRGGAGGDGNVGAGGVGTLSDGGGADLLRGTGGGGGRATGNGGTGAGGSGTLSDGGGSDLLRGAGGSGAGGTGAGGTGTGGTGGSGTGGTGGAQVCSDTPVMACPSGQVCDLDTPNRCTAGFEPGHCIVPPGGCTTIFNPVCGCNGTTFFNDCERQRARVQLDHAGSCAVDGGVDAPVGCALCNHATDYCQISIGGPAGSPPSYACLTLPPACGASPSCACLTAVACSSVCAGVAATGLFVTCFAP
ncbi:MAG TPA: Kazal-type serine protease inhibitor [Polyangia bacterium]|nr:Kazal-type serine protease inhibitor [Polyangia bacterium]